MDEIVQVIHADGTRTDVPANVRRAMADLLGARDLTTTEVARLLGVSREWVARLIDKGELHGHRVGRHRRVNRQDAIEYWRRTRCPVDEAANADVLSAVLELAAAMPSRPARALTYPRFGRRR